MSKELLLEDMIKETKEEIYRIDVYLKFYGYILNALSTSQHYKTISRRVETNMMKWFSENVDRNKYHVSLQFQNDNRTLNVWISEKRKEKITISLYTSSVSSGFLGSTEDWDKLTWFDKYRTEIEESIKRDRKYQKRLSEEIQEYELLKSLNDQIVALQETAKAYGKAKYGTEFSYQTRSYFSELFR